MFGQRRKEIDGVNAEGPDQVLVRFNVFVPTADRLKTDQNLLHVGSLSSDEQMGHRKWVVRSGKTKIFFSYKILLLPGGTRWMYKSLEKVRGEISLVSFLGVNRIKV